MEDIDFFRQNFREVKLRRQGLTLIKEETKSTKKFRSWDMDNGRKEVHHKRFVAHINTR